VDGNGRPARQRGMPRLVGHRPGRGGVGPEAIDEQTNSNYLSASAMPGPDLIIGASGEYRRSNFLTSPTGSTQTLSTLSTLPNHILGQRLVMSPLSISAPHCRRFGNGEHVGLGVLLQILAQLGIIAIDGIPSDRTSWVPFQ